jgi:hypothetical protein
VIIRIRSSSRQCLETCLCCRISEANERAGDVDKEENPHAWRPFNNFVETLEAKTSGHVGAKGATTKGRKKAKDGRKLEFDEEESGEEASGAEPTTPGTGTARSRLSSAPGSGKLVDVLLCTYMNYLEHPEIPDVSAQS